MLEADLPGFDKKDIAIDVHDHRLTIKAERHSNHEDKDKQGHYLRCERSYGSFTRSFDIDAIQEDKITASYTDGVLKLTLPKKQEVLPLPTRLPLTKRTPSIFLLLFMQGFAGSAQGRQGLLFLRNRKRFLNIYAFLSSGCFIFSIIKKKLNGGTTTMSENRHPLLDSLLSGSEEPIHELTNELATQSDAELDALFEQSKLLVNTIVDYKELMMVYSCAIKEIRTKFEVLNAEFNIRYQRNPSILLTPV